MQSTSALSSLLAFSCVFIIPVILGFSLLRRPKDDLTHMAGWLTLKPVLTTPLWLLILGAFTGNQFFGSFVAILPGALLSLVIARFYAATFASPTTSRVAKRLIILDCARWLNTLGLMVLPGGFGTVRTGDPAAYPFIPIMSLLGLTLPAIYGFIARASIPRGYGPRPPPKWWQGRI